MPNRSISETLLILFLICTLLLTPKVHPFDTTATTQETDFAKFDNLSYYGLERVFSSLEVSGTVVLCDNYGLNSSANFVNFSNTEVALGNWSKIAKSLEVKGTAILYENPDFTGRSAIFTSNTTIPYDNIGAEWNKNPNLTMSNDFWDTRIWYWGIDYLNANHGDEHNYVNWSSDGSVESSLQAGSGESWKAANFDQGYERNENEIYNLSDWGWNHQASSLIVEGSVTLYEGVGYAGSSITLVSDTPNLTTVNWTDRVSSLILGNNSRVTLYDGVNYTGNSMSFVNPSCQPPDLKVSDKTNIILDAVVQNWNTDINTQPGWTGAKFDIFAVENRSSANSKLLMLEMYFLRTGLNLAWSAWDFVPVVNGFWNGNEREEYRAPVLGQSSYNYLVSLDAFPGIANRTIYPNGKEEWMINVKAFIENACNHFSGHWLYLDISQLSIVKMCFTLEASSDLLRIANNTVSVGCNLERLRLAYTLPSKAMSSFYSFRPTPQVNETATFDATSSYIPGANFSNYTWDFGDGNTTTTIQPIIDHTYLMPGNYTVTLNATTDYGLWNTTSHQILVTFKSDLNRDGNVGLQDLTFVATSFGTRPGDLRWNAIADVNGNGKVDLVDLVTLAIDYGKMP